jgi:hypothetical protein
MLQIFVKYSKLGNLIHYLLDWGKFCNAEKLLNKDYTLDVWIERKYFDLIVSFQNLLDVQYNGADIIDSMQ